MQVAASEQVEVVEDVIEVVQRFALFKAVGQWPGLAIGGVKTVREAAEKLSLIHI